MDLKTGATSIAEVLGKKKGDLDASPGQLFFRPIADNTNTGFANVIIEIDKAKVGELAPSISLVSMKSNRAEQPKFQFSIAKSHKLSDSLYRVRLEHVRSDSREDFPKSIGLRVQYPDSQIMSLEIPCLFQY